MADPLTALAEREVPAPTNFFDPAGARDIISRYSNTRGERQAAREYADSAIQLSRLQDDQARRKRDELMQGREDQDYQARNDALLQKGTFIRNMGQMLDPKSEEYNSQVTEFMSGLPSELADDETIKGVLHSMNAEADDYRSQRNAELSKTQTRDSQLAVLRERAKLGMSYDVKDDDIKAATREDGTIDEFKLGTIAGANKRASAASEFDRRLKATEEGRIRVIQAADLSKRGRERRSTVDKFIVEDRAAFPRRTDAVANAYKEATGKSPDLKMLEVNPKWRDQVAQAKAWDSKPLDNELSAAFAYEDPEKYVNLVPGLNDSQKERRRMVWEHAHKDGAVEESDTPQSPAAAPSSTAPPAADPNQAAKDWLKANPDDPRAEAVRKKLGM